MNIKLKNKELAPAINFLQNLSLKATESRHRSKLVKLLTKAFEEFASEEKELLKKFDLLDENGAMVEESKRKNEQVIAFNDEQASLSEEIILIESGMFTQNIEKIPDILQNLHCEIKGQDAEIYDRLLDEFEKQDVE